VYSLLYSENMLDIREYSFSDDMQ